MEEIHMSMMTSNKNIQIKNIFLIVLIIGSLCVGTLFAGNIIRDIQSEEARQESHLNSFLNEYESNEYLEGYPLSFNYYQMYALGESMSMNLMTPSRGCSIVSEGESLYRTAWRGRYLPIDRSQEVTAVVSSNWNVHQIGISWCSLYLGVNTTGFTTIHDRLYVTTGDLRTYHFDILGSNNNYNWKTIQEGLSSTEYHSNFNPPDTGRVGRYYDMSWQDPSWNDMEWYDVDAGYRYYKIRINSMELSGHAMFDPNGSWKSYKYTPNEIPYAFPEIGEIKIRYTTEEVMSDRVSISNPRDNSIIQLSADDFLSITFDGYSELGITDYKFYFNEKEDRAFSFENLDYVMYDGYDETFIDLLERTLMTIGSIEGGYRSHITGNIIDHTSHWKEGHALGIEEGYYLHNPRPTINGGTSELPAMYIELDLEKVNFDYVMIDYMNVTLRNVGDIESRFPTVRQFETNRTNEPILYGELPNQRQFGEIFEVTENAQVSCYSEFFLDQGVNNVLSFDNNGGKYRFTNFGLEPSVSNPYSSHEGSIFTSWEYGTSFEMKYQAIGSYDNGTNIHNASSISNNDILYVAFDVLLHNDDSDVSSEINFNEERHLTFVIPITGGRYFNYDKLLDQLLSSSEIEDLLMTQNYFDNSEKMIYFPTEFHEQMNWCSGLYDWQTFQINNLETLFATLMKENDIPLSHLFGFEIVESTIGVFAQEGVNQNVFGRFFDPVTYSTAYEPINANFTDTYLIDDIVMKQFPKSDSLYSLFSCGRVEKNEDEYQLLEEIDFYYDENPILRSHLFTNYIQEAYLMDGSHLQTYLTYNSKDHTQEVVIPLKIGQSFSLFDDGNIETDLENPIYSLQWDGGYSIQEEYPYKYPPEIQHLHLPETFYDFASHLYQFGGVFITEISFSVLDISSFGWHPFAWELYQPSSYMDRFYDMAFPMSIGTSQPFIENLYRISNVEIRNLWETAHSSDDYVIETQNSPVGRYTNVVSENPTNDSYIEIDLNFPYSGVYDVYLTRSFPDGFVEGNLYDFYINDELVRTSQQSGPVATDLLSILFYSIEVSQDYDEFMDLLDEYEVYNLLQREHPSARALPFPIPPDVITLMQTFLRMGISYYDFLSFLGLNINSPYSLRVVSDYFEAGTHTLRVQFNSHQPIHKFDPILGMKTQMDKTSYIGLDSAVLYHRTPVQFRVPVSHLKDTLDDPTSRLHNMTLIGYRDGVEVARDVSHFQINTPPSTHLNQRGIYERIFDLPSLDTCINQMETYTSESKDTYNFFVNVHDYNLKPEDARWRLNDGEWQPFSIIEERGLRTHFRDIVARDEFINGENLIHIQISDIQGNMVEDFLTFIYDEIPPNVSLAEMSNVEMMGDEYHIGREMPIFTIEASDDSYIAKMEYRIEHRSQQEIWIPFFDIDLNRTRRSHLFVDLYAPSSEFMEGENILYVRVTDRAGHQTIVNYTVIRTDRISMIRNNTLKNRYVGEDVEFSVQAENIGIDFGSGGLLQHIPTVSNIKSLLLGRSDFTSFDYIIQPFQPIEHVIRGIELEIGYPKSSPVGDRYPIILEILSPCRTEVLTRGYGMPPAFDENRVQLTRFHFPAIIVEPNELYYMRVVPLVQHSVYTLGYRLGDNVPVEVDAKAFISGGVDFYDTGILTYDEFSIAEYFGHPKGKRINYRMTYFTYQVIDSAGEIRWRVNSQSEWTSAGHGDVDITIPKEYLVHGQNTVHLEIDNGAGNMLYERHNIVWVDPEVNTPPEIRFLTPVQRRGYHGNITIEMETSFPDYQETYDIQLYFKSEHLSREVWIGNETVLENTTTTRVTHTFNTTEMLPQFGGRWIKDCFHGQIIAYIDDGTYQRKNMSAIFNINNDGALLSVRHPLSEYRINQRGRFSFEALLVDSQMRQSYYTLNSIDGPRHYVSSYRSISSGINTTFLYDFYMNVHTLPEGPHTMYFTIVDEAAGVRRNSTIAVPFVVDRSIELIVDMVRPRFPNSFEDTILHYYPEVDMIEIRVFMSYVEIDGASGFRHFATIQGDEINGTINFGQLPIGNYQILMIAVDMAGNQDQVQYQFDVTEGGGLYKIGEHGANIFGLFASIFSLGLSIYHVKERQIDFTEVFYRGD